MIIQPTRFPIIPSGAHYHPAITGRRVAPWRSDPAAPADLTGRHKTRAQRELGKMLSAWLGLGYPLERVVLDPNFIERVHPGRDRFAGMFDTETYFRPKGATGRASHKDTIVVVEPGFDNRPGPEGYGHWFDGQILDEWAVKRLLSVWCLNNPDNPRAEAYAAFSVDLL